MATAPTYTPGAAEADFDPKQGFLEYESLKQEEKMVKSRIDVLKPLLLKAFPADVDEIPLEDGVIMRKQGRPSYTYSEQLENRIEALDADKEREQQDGSAKVKFGESFLEYRVNKG